MILSHYYINKDIRRLIAARDATKRKFCPLERARRVLILLRENERMALEAELERFARGRTLYFVSYTNDALAPSPSDDRYTFSLKKELNLWGYPSERLMAEWLSHEADMLIDLSQGEIPALQYLVLRHAAPCKIGIKGRTGDIYDLAIAAKDGEDVNFLFNQIIFYLETINFK